MMTAPGGPVETLDSVPPHVWKGLPEDMTLRPSAVSQNRIGVWASRLIPKGKRFGPFVGERKKRSQVTSNVYMWEVYFPAWGWMCIDATDPAKGNWLRYVNWAHSTQEQNLFPLEINRAIYYKVLKPIEPGEELLVWYNGEDNPEIAAAIEEERVSSLGRKSSPRGRRARRKLLERARARRAGLGGFRGPEKASGPEAAIPEMQHSDNGMKVEGVGLSPSSEVSAEESSFSQEIPSGGNETTLQTSSVTVQEEQHLQEMQEEPQLNLKASSPVDTELIEAEELSVLEPSCHSPEEEATGGSEQESVSVSPVPNLEAETDPDHEGESQGEAHFHCQHCERHFTTKQGLERHTHIHVMANHQSHTFRCRYCNKPFGSQVGCRRHERRHENGLKKRPGSLSGATALSSSLVSDGSSSEHLVAPGQSLVINVQNSCGPPEDLEDKKQNVETQSRTIVLDENGESREVFPCKYCKKAFGTHTNMRRHQRRIHERHLLPKGVRRKGMLLQEGLPQQPAPVPEESPSASPPPVYLPSGDAEDEGDQDQDYIIDVSSNISENLSLYIDGKILSTSTVSTCEVIEVNSNTPASLFGVDAVIITSDKITQAIKLENATSTVNESPNAVQSATKRRTSTPPLLPEIKTESSESDPGIPSSTSLSSSSAPLVGGLIPQATDNFAIQKEKTVYLSPKLKQLLQTQDNQKPAVTLTPEGHRLVSPLMSVSTLPTPSGRFKRRTASPPNSPQLSPVQKGESSKSEGALFALKLPKLEGQCRSPVWTTSNKDGDKLSPSEVDTIKSSALDWSSARSGGRSCNQQPLDLSSAMGRRNDGLNKGPGEAVLDLSVHRKSSSESEVRVSQPLAKKKKPNTSMLEKVLMNEYASSDTAVDEVTCLMGSSRVLSATDTAGSTPDTACTNSENLPSESALHPPPPSLTPVTMNPPSPSTPTLASPTPPPPVLPTVPSPLSFSSSPTFQSPDSPVPNTLPVLSPETSPRPAELNAEEPSENDDADTLRLESLNEEFSANTAIADIAEPLNPKDNTQQCVMLMDTKISHEIIKPSASESVTVSETVCSSSASFSVTDDKAALGTGSSSFLTQNTTDGASAAVQHEVVEATSNHSIVMFEDTEGQEQPLSPSTPQSLDPPILVASLPESPLMSSLHHGVISESPPPLVLPPPPVSMEVKDESPHRHELANVSLSPNSATSDRTSDDESCELDTFCKNFVCNVCEKPFRSIKELSFHIKEHALDWPFKCEFCVQLFENSTTLLEHRSSLHGVGRIYTCCVCAKEFAFLCNLQQHQQDLHPGQDCVHTVVENGKLRPQNYTDPEKASTEYALAITMDSPGDCTSQVGTHALKDEEEEQDDSTEELYTTIKIMASEGGKPKGPDVRLGMNQHYPSFKPPPFPYHNRTPAGSLVSATNFTTHNIPQTFSTAIRCTKCGKSFDNMPELHKHILVCASASDKRRYTPKKNPVPLRQIAKPQNGALSPVTATSPGQNAFRRMGQPKRLNFGQDSLGKIKLSALSKKNKLVQKAISQRNKSAGSAKKGTRMGDEEQDVHVCPHCSREFTYLGSLNKHVTVSCPMRPVPKKARKGAADVLGTQDKNINLRRRTADAEIKQQGSDVVQKTLGKTRARSSGPTDGSNIALKPLASKGKMSPSQVRQKRPASLQSALVPFSKKNKNSQVQTQRQSLLQPPGPSFVSSASSSQRTGKELSPKNGGQTRAQQHRKEERFSTKVRDRVGGPVTRSFQLASVTNQMELKTEHLSSQESREAQESLLKLAS